MTADESLRRQLRFAFFLQVAAAALFAVAALVRIVSFGVDLLAVVFLCLALVIGGAATFTRRKMQDLTP
ncbi:MAG: hypothetical protein RL134_2637 [Actinomycetota bacterium]|jgi:hypothetical protein